VPPGRSNDLTTNGKNREMKMGQSSHEHEPQGNLPVKADMGLRLMTALKEGKAGGMVRALLDDFDGDKDKAMMELARISIQHRRRDIAVLGKHDVFVRHTADGSLMMVVQAVELSTDAGDIYQIKDSVKVTHWEGKRKVEQWVRNPAAMVQYQGVQKMNAVAGLSIGQPPMIFVDGEKRSNPYIERDDEGNVMRIVIQIVVIGPAPVTGNPVAVSYLHDHDPRKDLIDMMIWLEKESKGVELVKKTDPRCEELRYKFFSMYAGIGYLCDLTHSNVREKIATFNNTLGLSPRKAQTVAKRNALLSHPALGGNKSVLVDESGKAKVAVIGWAGDSSMLDQYKELADRVSKGMPLPDDLEVLDAEGAYEPEEEAQVIEGVEEEIQITPEEEERNALINEIDRICCELNPADVQGLGYDSSTQTVEQLEAVYMAAKSKLDMSVGES
jgi:hypothetical protein